MRAASFCVTSALSLGLACVTAGCGRETTDFTIVGNVLGVAVNLQCGPVSTTVTGTRSSN